jgi:hypothetical protein
MHQYEMQFARAVPAWGTEHRAWSMEKNEDLWSTAYRLPFTAYRISNLPRKTSIQLTWFVIFLWYLACTAYRSLLTVFPTYLVKHPSNWPDLSFSSGILLVKTSEDLRKPVSKVVESGEDKGSLT